jgi:hypothetical protein
MQQLVAEEIRESCGGAFARLVLIDKKLVLGEKLRRIAHLYSMRNRKRAFKGIEFKAMAVVNERLQAQPLIGRQ